MKYNIWPTYASNQILIPATIPFDIYLQFEKIPTMQATSNHQQTKMFAQVTAHEPQVILAAYHM